MQIKELGIFGTGSIPQFKTGDIPIYGGNGIMGYTNETNAKINTIIIGRVGAQCGNVNILKQDAYVSDNALTFIAHKEYNPLFIYYLFSTMNLNQYHIGSTQPLLTQSIIGLLNVFDLPDRKTQDKIVEILSGIDDQIARNNAMTKKLQVLGNTIYSKIMNYQKADVLLGDIATMYQPETITSDKFISNGKYPVYGAGGIIGFYNKYNHENSELMLSCRGICGKAEISLPNSFIIGNQMIIKTKDEKIKYFLYNYFLNSDLSKVETGSVQKQITRTNLEKMPIKLPPIEIIHQHSNVLENIYNMKTKITLENTKLNKLKEKILPLLINGQLSI